MNNFNKLLTYAQQVRMEIQEKLGCSGNIINTSDLNRGIRAEQQENQDDEFNKDASKFFYTSPLDFFKNHRKNMEEFIDKHISQPIDKLNKDITGE
jgi:hypothetical protein